MVKNIFLIITVFYSPFFSAYAELGVHGLEPRLDTLNYTIEDETYSKTIANVRRDPFL